MFSKILWQKPIFLPIFCEIFPLQGQKSGAAARDAPSSNDVNQ